MTPITLSFTIIGTLNQLSVERSLYDTLAAIMRAVRGAPPTVRH